MVNKRDLAVVLVALLTITAVATVGGLAHPGTHTADDRPDAATSSTYPSDHPDNGSPSSINSPSNETNESDKPHPKLSSQVVQLADEAKTGNFDSELVTHADGQTLITIRIESKPGKGEAVRDIVARNGGNIETSYKHLFQARLPPNNLSTLTASDAITFVRVPLRPETSAVESEGLDNMHVPTVHANGITGENVTVAIIDTGFNVSNPEIKDNVAGFKDFQGNGMENTTGEHGTAVAELVVDTAPNTTLLLYEVSTSIEMYNSINHVDKIRLLILRRHPWVGLLVRLMAPL